MWFNRDIEKDGVVVRNVASERCAVSRKPSVKLVSLCFHLHIIAKHTLTRITVVCSGGKECFKHDADESRPLVGAHCEMRRVNQETAERGPITRIIEDTYRSLVRNGYGGNGSLHLAGDEDFRANGEATGTIIGQPARRQPIVASIRIAVTVNVDHVTRLRVHRGVIYAAQQRVDRTELGRWLSAVSIGNNDAGRAAVEAPCVAAICRAIEHLIDVL